MKNMIEKKLDRLAELYYQQFDSGYAELSRDLKAKAAPNQLASELEISDEMLTLSKEVAAAGVLTVNVLEPTEGCAVFEVASVLPQHKSFFNEGKILLLCEEVQVNGEGKLIPEFQKRLGKFANTRQDE